MKATSDLDYCLGRSTLSTALFFGTWQCSEGGAEGGGQPNSVACPGTPTSRHTAGPWGGAVELVMPEPTVRERILQALEDLPPEATFDDAIERLVFLAKIDEGLAELDAGEGIPHDEAKRRLGL